MCLSLVWPKKKQKEWLKKRKSPLIVYNKAKLGDEDQYCPWVYNNKPYKEGMTNLPKRKRFIMTFGGNRPEKYRPYFHRFAKLHDAKNWGYDHPRTVILKWRCYKKDVTAIGINGTDNKKGRIAVIARKLTLLGEVKPKKKKKKSA